MKKTYKITTINGTVLKVKGAKTAEEAKGAVVADIVGGESAIIDIEELQAEQDAMAGEAAARAEEEAAAEYQAQMEGEAESEAAYQQGPEEQY